MMCVMLLYIKIRLLCLVMVFNSPKQSSARPERLETPRREDGDGAGYYPFRPTRVLRPALLPYLSRTCAHMALSIAHTIPSLADLALCVLAMVLFFSLTAASLFGSDPTAMAAANANHNLVSGH